MVMAFHSDVARNLTDLELPIGAGAAAGATATATAKAGGGGGAGAGLSRRLKCTPMLSPEDVSSIESCTHGGSSSSATTKSPRRFTPSMAPSGFGASRMATTPLLTPSATTRSRRSPSEAARSRGEEVAILVRRSMQCLSGGGGSKKTSSPADQALPSQRAERSRRKSLWQLLPPSHSGAS